MDSTSANIDSPAQNPKTTPGRSSLKANNNSGSSNNITTNNKARFDEINTAISIVPDEN